MAVLNSVLLSLDSWSPAVLSPNNREFRSVSKLQVPNLLRSLASRVITCDEAWLTYIRGNARL